MCRRETRRINVTTFRSFAFIMTQNLNEIQGLCPVFMVLAPNWKYEKVTTKILSPKESVAGRQVLYGFSGEEAMACVY